LFTLRASQVLGGKELIEPARDLGVAANLGRCSKHVRDVLASRLAANAGSAIDIRKDALGNGDGGLSVGHGCEHLVVTK
jgi:hypothetical protein